MLTPALVHVGYSILAFTGLLGASGVVLAALTQDKRIPFWVEILVVSLGLLIGSVIAAILLWII